MKSIDFAQANLPLAKDQPEYETLHVYFDRTDQTLPMTSCMELSEEEVREVIKTRKIWFKQLTFGKGYNPILMSTQCPFEKDVNVSPAEPSSMSVDEWKKSHYLGPDKISGVCENCGRKEWEHLFSLRQCKLEINKQQTYYENLVTDPCGICKNCGMAWPDHGVINKDCPINELEATANRLEREKGNGEKKYFKGEAVKSCSRIVCVHCSKTIEEHEEDNECPADDLRGAINRDKNF